MKKLITIAGAIGMAMTFASCGSIGSLVTHGKRPVFLMQTPSDIEATLNGKKLETHRDAFASNERSNGYTKTTTTYYATSIRLPYKKSIDIELYSPSTNKRATVHLKSKASGKIIVGDILFTGGAGLLLDIPTKNHKVLKPHFIDVERALEGKTMKDWRSQGKLKRMAKRHAR